MSNNLRVYLDKMKAKGFPTYKVEKELKIGNGYLGKICLGRRIMTGDVLDKITPFFSEKLGEPFVYEEKIENEMKCIPVEDFKKMSDVVEIKGAGDAEGFTFLVQRCEALEDKDFWSKLRVAPIDDRTNPLINAARGRDESGINEDELKPALKSGKSKKGKKKDGEKDKTIPPVDEAEMPIKKEGESGMDFKLRMNVYLENKNKAS